MATEEPDWLNPQDQEAFPPSGGMPQRAKIPTKLSADTRATRSPEDRARMAKALATENAMPTAAPSGAPASEKAVESIGAGGSASGGSGSKKVAVLALAGVLGCGALIGGGLALSGGGSDDPAEETAQVATDSDGEDMPGQLGAVDEAESDADSEAGDTPQNDAAPAVEEAEVDVEPAEAAPVEEPVEEPVEAAVETPVEAAPEDAGPAEGDIAEEAEEEPVFVAGAVDETRYGRYADGKITVTGPVPDRETADRLIAKAGEVIGAENVIDDYTIDPSAPVASGGLVIVDDPVLFKLGSSEINAEFFPLLDLGILVLTLNPESSMRVIGHTDDAGDAEVNEALSLSRAGVVVDYMVAGGVDRSRFEAVGLGESQPRESNDTEAGRAANRRIDVQLLNLIS